VTKDAVLNFKQIINVESMTIIDDNGYLLSLDQRIQRILLWVIALISQRFCLFYEVSSARNSPLLLAVLEVLHMK